MYDSMLAKLQDLAGNPKEHDPDAPEARPLDWHALRARLEAERDLRNSLNGDGARPRHTWQAAEGSFDPRAAEAIFSHCRTQGRDEAGHVSSPDAETRTARAPSLPDDKPSRRTSDHRSPDTTGNTKVSRTG